MRTPVSALLLSLLLCACGGPRTVSLADLAHEPERFAGDTVIATGVVIEFGDEQGATARHFALQDTEANRVELVPEGSAEEHVGSLVRATGTFRFDDATGRVLELDEVVPAGG